jgi:hypothetical protein
MANAPFLTGILLPRSGTSLQYKSQPENLTPHLSLQENTKHTMDVRCGGPQHPSTRPAAGTAGPRPTLARTPYLQGVQVAEALWRCQRPVPPLGTFLQSSSLHFVALTAFTDFCTWLWPVPVHHRKPTQTLTAWLESY